MKMRTGFGTRSLYLGLLFLAISFLAAASDNKPPPLDEETKTNIANALWMLNFDPDQIPPKIRQKLRSSDNSNPQFGSRFRSYLMELINNPPTFIPDYTAYYKNLINLTPAISPHQAHGRTSFGSFCCMGVDRSSGFRDIPKFDPQADLFKFPRDHEVDLQADFGWYYGAGSVTGNNGRQYGIVYMPFFTPNLSPPVAHMQGVTDEQNMIAQLQLEINEAGGQHFEARPTVVAGTTGLLDFPRNKIAFTMGKNHFGSLPGSDIFPLQMIARGWDFSYSPPAEIEINIVVSNGSAILFEGNRGCLPCCGRVGTLYYSIPRMTVDPKNSFIRIRGQTIPLVDGVFWFDHQWGTGGYPKIEALRAGANVNGAETPSDDTGLPGWDFIAMDFTGNRELIAYYLHKHKTESFYNVTDDKPKPGTLTAPLVVKYIDASDHVLQTIGTLNITDWISATTTPDASQFPPTHIFHPNRWEFTFGDDLPADIRNITLTPITSQPSTLFFANGAQYQEAPSNITNEKGDHVGTGTGESVGYAFTNDVILNNQLRLAGLSGMPADFIPPKPDAALIAQSKDYLDPNKHPDHFATLFDEALHCGDVPGQNDTNPIPVVGRFN